MLYRLSFRQILVAQDIVIIDLLNCDLWHMVWYCVSHSHIVEGWKTKKYGHISIAGGSYSMK